MNLMFKPWFIPFVLFCALIVFMAKGLWLNPRVIPSARLNQPIPAFHLSSLINEHRLIDEHMVFSPSQVTLLNVFASWCMACVDEQAMIAALSEQGYRLVGLNYRDDAQEAKRWISAYGNPYQEVIFDPSGRLSMDLGVYGAPELFVIDTAGRIRYRHVGIITERIWQERIKPLVLELEQPHAVS